MTPDLFAGMEVDYGEWRPSLSDARKLVAEVEGLASLTDTFYDQCQRVIARARKLGAWSVARAVCWISTPDTFDRYGYSEVHIRVEKVARKWLERWERERLS